MSKGPRSYPTTYSTCASGPDGQLLNPVVRIEATMYPDSGGVGMTLVSDESDHALAKTVSSMCLETVLVFDATSIDSSAAS